MNPLSDDPAIHREVRNFLDALAAACKGCLRKGSTCPRCPGYTATGLLKQIEPPAIPMTPAEERAASVALRKRAILERIAKSAPNHCYAGDIRIPGCESNLRSMTLAELVHEGKVIRHDGGGRELPYYSIAPAGYKPERSKRARATKGVRA